MNVRDFIYLDEGRLASFLSQRKGFVADFTSEVDADEKGKVRERPGASGVVVEATSARQASVLQGRSHDARWARFLDQLVSKAAEIRGDNAAGVAEAALADGAIVRAQGTFFIDDFGELQKTLGNAPQFFDLMEAQQKAAHEIQLAAFNATKPSGQQRNAWEAQKQQLIATLAGISATAQSTKRNFEQVRKLVVALLGDGVECGVVLRGGPPPLLLRSVLDRTWLREPVSTLIDRYGSRSAVGFTVVGIVTRLSWSEKLYLSPDEQEGSETALGRSSAGTVAAAATSVRTAIGTAQGIMESLREQLMSRTAEEAIFVAPLAIYRTLALAEPEIGAVA